MRVDTYFTPADGKAAIAAIVALFDGAKSSIDGINFCVDHPAICAALERAAARKIGVGTTGIVLDVSEIQRAPAVARGLHGMLLGGVPADAFTVGDVNGHIEHYKCWVIDGKTVIGGSMNYTSSAPEEGNVVHIFHSGKLASAFLAVIAAEKARIRQTEPQYQALIA